MVKGKHNRVIGFQRGAVQIILVFIQERSHIETSTGGRITEVYGLKRGLDIAEQHAHSLHRSHQCIEATAQLPDFLKIDRFRIGR